MVKFFKAVVFSIRLNREIRKAKRGKARTGHKHLVLNVAGKPMCVSKMHIQNLIGKGGVFKEGTKMADISKVALFIAR